MQNRFSLYSKKRVSLYVCLPCSNSVFMVYGRDGIRLFLWYDIGNVFSTLFSWILGRSSAFLLFKKGSIPNPKLIIPSIAPNHPNLMLSLEDFSPCSKVFCTFSCNSMLLRDNSLMLLAVVVSLVSTLLAISMFLRVALALLP